MSATQKQNKYLQSEKDDHHGSIRQVALLKRWKLPAAWKKLEFAIGDTVNVAHAHLEGDKERIQIFNGVIIAAGEAVPAKIFTVRRMSPRRRRTHVHHELPKISSGSCAPRRSGRAKLFYLASIGSPPVSWNASRLKDKKTKGEKAAE